MRTYGPTLSPAAYTRLNISKARSKSRSATTAVLKAMVPAPDRGLKVVPYITSPIFDDMNLRVIQCTSWTNWLRSLKKALDCIFSIITGYGRIPVSYTHLRAHETRHDL